MKDKNTGAPINQEEISHYLKDIRKIKVMTAEREKELAKKMKSDDTPSSERRRIEQELIVGAVYAPALNDYYCAEKGKGAWKNGLPIHVSSEANLAESMVATGFACLRSFLIDNNLERFGRIAHNTTGQRRFGSAAMDLCLVADGQVDAFWEQELNLYDVAAGALIAQEAGGTITDFKGNEGLFPKQVLATNGLILNQILPLM